MAGLIEDRPGRGGNGSPDGLVPRPEIQVRRTEFDGITYEAPTWDQMGVYSFALARQMLEAGQSFDRIVALARGGWTWSRHIIDALQVPEVSSIRIVSYTGINEAKKPRIVQPLTDSIEGERVLLLDEVVDSGETFEVAMEHLWEKNPLDVKTAALSYKPRSIIKPDFFAFETDAWVAFPHEPREFVRACINRWKPTGLSIDATRDRLIEIGIDPREAEYYLHKEWATQGK